MSDVVGVRNSTPTWESPPLKTLDEGVWLAWKAKGRDRDRRGREARVKVLKWGSIVALLIVAGLWFQVAPYALAIRCFVAAAAAGMMFEAFHKRQYELVAVFAGLALLYNPVTPVFSFSGNWQRALVVATALPFISSLAWREMKAAPIA